MASQAPSTYDLSRDRLTAYFDGTARKAWEDLTGDAKVSGIRATVRAGRDSMRAALLGWLPDDLGGVRLLDAGCGTGALSVDAAARGASVTAIDVAGGLVDIAARRAPSFPGEGRIDWRTGDMLDPALGDYDHVVAMDSLIHYSPRDLVTAIVALAPRCRRSILFTVAPKTPLLTLMHRAGKLFPRADRSPAIVPVAEGKLRAMLGPMPGWRIARSHRVNSGFYMSHAFELVRD
ncbi:magnesium protoporphyrin IX methyltransferase [Sphingomonas sp. ASV193]|uniref:magnesium protoporphyrin IX methyltransferase n=1 Tax=Sphingomonas sp. ASV193 TaxID=3144405 RepID=UPI0032E908DE